MAGKSEFDSVNRPKHYNSSPASCVCGATIECIQVTETMDFVLGNIVKYAWRAGLKDSSTALEDLKKCVWYANRAVAREEKRLRSGRKSGR